MSFQFSHYQVAPDLHVFRAHMGRVDMMFNSYLLMAQRPVLIHTGNQAMWADVRPLLASVLPLNQLAYVVVPHFEADECGAIALLLQEAQPTVIASGVGRGQLMGFGLVDHPQSAQDGDRINLGDRELELIAVPSEMHLWDGLIAFDHKTGTLFSTDFLSQLGGSTPPIAEVPDLAGIAKTANNNIPCTGPYERVVRRLLGLDIRLVAPGHGSCFTQRIPQLIQEYFARSLPV